MKRLLFLSLLTSSAALADDAKPLVTFDAHHRLRFESGGNKDLKDNDRMEAFGQAVRLGARFDLADWVTLVARFQDVRAWGAEPNTLTVGGNVMDLHEGYIALTPWTGVTLEAGRRTWAYDDERIIGTVGWALQERRFDGGRVRLLLGGVEGDLFYAKLAEPDTLAPNGNNDTDLVGLHATYKFSSYVASLLAVADFDDTDDKERKRATAGLFFRGTPGMFKVRLEGYAQLGKVGDEDLLAFFAGGEFGVVLKEVAAASVTLGADFLSGDDKPAEGKIKSFDTMFGTNHKFYGLMDFFTAFPKDTGGRGLLDAWARLGADPMANLNVAATYHLFRLATKDDKDDSALGHEIDLEVGWSPIKQLRIYGGGGVMLPGASLKNLKGGNDDMEVWAFIQTDVRM